MIDQEIGRMSDELISMNYSKQTIKTYTAGLIAFSKWFKLSLYMASKEDLKRYKIYVVNEKVEPKTINTYLAGVQFYFKHVLKRRGNVGKVREKKKLPRIVSHSEVLKMIDLTKNLKHKLLLVTLYSSGLRVSEVVGLKFDHLNLSNKTCLVRQGKGRKDRISVLSDDFVIHLSEFGVGSGYIFPGRKGKMTTRTVQEIVKQAGRRIKKNVHPHMLRHSFATSVLDQGGEISNLQKVMGHKNIKTTLCYTYLAKPKVTSPMDTQ